VTQPPQTGPAAEGPERVAAPSPARAASDARTRAPLWRSAVAILLLVAVAAAGWATMPTGGHGGLVGRGTPARLLIVVLPFTNLSSDSEQDYFVEAITQDLTTDLSRISGSIVIAHGTAQAYRDRTPDVRQIGRELDVRYVLEGSVRRMGGQVEVNAR